MRLPSFMSVQPFVTSVTVFVALWLGGPVLSSQEKLGNAPSQRTMAEVMHALIIDAFVQGGWSERDAETIADYKLERMIQREMDGEIPNFVPQDKPGRLSEYSEGTAAVEGLFIKQYLLTHEEASFQTQWLYSMLNDWEMAGGPSVPLEDPSKQPVIEIVRYLLMNAYTSTGWSDRDAETIAEVKIQRMVNREADGAIPGFVPQDVVGGLSEFSEGTAAIAKYLVDQYQLSYSFALFQSSWLYSQLNDWEMHGGVRSSGSESCYAYWADYEFCQNGQFRSVSQRWNSPCTAQNFVNNPCVDTPRNCYHCQDDFCAITYTPVGGCHGVPPGTCIRLTTLRGPTLIDCSRIKPDYEGGCADCSPPASFESNCENPVVRHCVDGSGSCPQCD